MLLVNGEPQHMSNVFAFFTLTPALRETGELPTVQQWKHHLWEPISAAASSCHDLTLTCICYFSHSPEGPVLISTTLWKPTSTEKIEALGFELNQLLIWPPTYKNICNLYHS